MQGVSEIPAEVLPYLQERFAKLAKRAKRLRKPAPELIVVSRFKREVNRLRAASGQEVVKYREYAWVQVEGERPQAGDYEPIANLMATPAGNVVRAREGVTVPERFRNRNVCDHCGTKRQRKETWIFRHRETGELVQVGRNCCQDYTGGALSPSAMAVWADAWGYVADPDAAGSGAYGPSVRAYLEYVAACIRVDRYYLSKTKARDRGDIPTAERASQVMGIWMNNPRLAEKEGLPRPNGDDVDVVNKALAWVENVTPDSDYLHSLKAACSLPTVTHKTEGYVASLIGAAYPKAMGQERKKSEAKAADAGSVHVGNVKDRITFDATVTRVRSWEGHYGMTTLVIFKDDNGNVLQWYASGEKRIDEGERVTVTGTVKKHTTDRYTAADVTVLTRCKFTYKTCGACGEPTTETGACSIPCGE